MSDESPAFASADELIAAVTERLTTPAIQSARRVDPYAFILGQKMAQDTCGTVPWDVWLFLAFYFGDTESRRCLSAAFPFFLSETDMSHIHNE